jgi:hypothetical protein
MAVASGLMMGGVAQAGTGGASRMRSYPVADTHLVIKRAPNFGNHTNINVYIDGQRVAGLTYGRKFEGMVAPGLHLVTLKQSPHVNDAYPYSQQWIRVAPGQTNVFTAIWRDGGTQIRLEES